MLNINYKQKEILANLDINTAKNVNDLSNALNISGIEVSKTTLNRELAELIEYGFIVRLGSARATAYLLSKTYNLIRPIDFAGYQKAKTEPVKNIYFNHRIFDELKSAELFTHKEKDILEELGQKFSSNIKSLSEVIKKREYERLTVEFSWKSSALEGNTYTILETETLLKDGLPAKGHAKEETQMLINHKDALKFIFENRPEFRVLKPKLIEDIHKILVKDLGITSNFRKTLVGITGVDYKPLDNVFQITEAINDTCKLINDKENIYEKALLTLLLISYIQPFEDGNKRTGRLLANAILLSNNVFPLSFRSVDATAYKEALVIFYEINNLANFKNIFIEQAQYSVENYFKP